MTMLPTFLQTAPSAFQMTTYDSIYLPCDWTSFLNSPESVVSATVTVLDAYSLDAVTLTSGAPTVENNVVTQLLKGSDFAVGHSYRILWTAVLSSDNTVTQETDLQVPY